MSRHATLREVNNVRWVGIVFKLRPENSAQ